MKNGWLNLDLLESLSALSFLVFLFIKCEEIPCNFFKNRDGTFHGRDLHLKEDHLKPPGRNVVGKPEKPMRATRCELAPRTHVHALLVPRTQAPCWWQKGRAGVLRWNLSTKGLEGPLFLTYICGEIFLFIALNMRDLCTLTL